MIFPIKMIKQLFIFYKMGYDAFIRIATEEELNEEIDRFQEHMLEEDDIDPNLIHAALEQSQKDGEHGPLVTKSNKPRRPYYKKKKA
jgi:hypothetical protein